jgi:membrane-bound ClpP family serine protease
MITDIQLAICKQCKLQSWEFTKGTVCSLTEDYPTFNSSCDTFEFDEEKSKKYTLAVENRKQNELEDKTFGLSTFGIKSQTTAGLIVTFIGVFLTLFTVTFMGIMSIWTLAIIVTGLIFVARGVKEKASINAGVITAVMGVFLTLSTVTFMGIISIWTLAIIVTGVVFLVQGIRSKASASDNDFLDSQL